MEAQNPECHGHVVEICADFPDAEKGYGESKMCGGATCGFSDANNTSKDAKNVRHP